MMSFVKIGNNGQQLISELSRHLRKQRRELISDLSWVNTKDTQEWLSMIIASQRAQ